MKKNTFDPFMINNFSNITRQSKSVSITGNDNNSDFAGMTFIEKSMNIRTPKAKSGLVLLIESDSMGDSNELGQSLIRNFLFSISDGLDLPEYILFVNTAIEILKDENMKEVLKRLKRYGTNLVVSCESIEFLGLNSNIRLAQKWSIGEISALIMNAEKVIKI